MYVLHTRQEILFVRLYSCGLEMRAETVLPLLELGLLAGGHLDSADPFGWVILLEVLGGEHPPNSATLEEHPLAPLCELPGSIALLWWLQAWILNLALQ